MCGIFGFHLSVASTVSERQGNVLLRSLIRYSESRGKEASGVSLLSGADIRILRAPIPGTEIIRLPVFRNEIERLFGNLGTEVISVIGHSRLVTNGNETDDENNQPLAIKTGVGVHNGIIVNVDELAAANTEIQLQTDVDTEIFMQLLEKYRSASESSVDAVGRVLSEVEGTASLALQFIDSDYIALLTNNGSLYWWQDSARGIAVFASERFVLRKALNKAGLDFVSSDISRLAPFEVSIIDERGSQVHSFAAGSGPKIRNENRIDPVREVIAIPLHVESPADRSGTTLATIGTIAPDLQKKLSVDYSAIEDLRRCSRCILPETMPFISFDEAGICNYCNGYRKRQPLGNKSLQAQVEDARKITDRPNCIVNVSGGRDSSYGLHYVKHELGLNPIAYTYDWGMVTDLARRNIARLCGKMGVEHIVVSADIALKRRNIRNNVQTWLRNPSLGMIPLFMAGDKQYFYFSRRLREQTEIDLIITCRNELEKTHFKSGFAGIMETPDNETGRSTTYDVSIFKKMRIGAYYLKQFISNPGYLNASLVDTASAFYSAYMQTHDFLYLYDYVLWDETAIMDVLTAEYDWEKATDTKSTWRIGDGTTPFYNYIYYTVAGFTENDTFQSNCVREGLISREQALQIAQVRNAPRFESIKWYCDILGLDFEDVVGTINAIPRFY